VVLPKHRPSQDLLSPSTARLGAAGLMNSSADRPPGAGEAPPEPGRLRLGDTLVARRHALPSRMSVEDEHRHSVGSGEAFTALASTRRRRGLECASVTLVVLRECRSRLAGSRRLPYRGRPNLNTTSRRLVPRGDPGSQGEIYFEVRKPGGH